MQKSIFTWLMNMQKAGVLALVGIISYISPLYLHFTIIMRILTSMNNTFCGHLSRHFNDMKNITILHMCA